MVHELILGILVGIGACFAPGPINLEIIRRAIVRGPKYGFLFGLGAITADFVFLFLALTGAGVLWSQVPYWGKGVLCLSGATLLLVMGIRNLLAKTHKDEEEIPDDVDLERTEASRLWKNYFVALALTMSSPTTIAFWIIVALSVVGIRGTGSWFTVILPFMLGVVGTCLTWVTTVSYLSGHLQNVFSKRRLVTIDRAVGVLLIVFASFTFYNGFITITSGEAGREPTGVEDSKPLNFVRDLGQRAGLSIDLGTTHTVEKHESEKE